MFSDESIDLDPNYDPSDFLAMHKPRQSFNEPSYNAQGAFSDFMSQVQDDNGEYNPSEGGNNTATASLPAPQQEDDLPAASSTNNGMGIDEDLDISESDEDDEGGGGGVRIKKEVFDDSESAVHHQSQEPIQSQIYLLDNSNEAVHPSEYQTQATDFQPAQDLDQPPMHLQPLPVEQDVQQQEQQQQDQPKQQGDADYDWLTF